MNVLACYSIKGGVGKTTSAVNLGYLSALRGNSTLLWDLDLQGSASLILSPQTPEKKIYKLLANKKTDLNNQIQQTKFKNLDLIPGDFSLHKIDQHLNGSQKNAISLKQHLKSFRKKYECIIIDCPSGYSPLTQHILQLVDVVLTPVIPSPFCFDVLERLKKQIKKGKLTEGTLLFPFFSMVDRRKKLHQDVLRLNHNGKRGFLGTAIPYTNKAELMAVEHAPLPYFDSRTNASKAYKALWTEIHDSIGMYERVKKIKMW